MEKFWKDKWCEYTPLSVSFPFLFALADSKEAWVEDIWNSSIEKRKKRGGEGGRGCGTLASLDLSTIGRWIVWRDV